MPYINQEKREKLSEPLKNLIEILRGRIYKPVHSVWDEGDINFVIYTILLSCWKDCPRYATANKLIGILNAVEKEFYRREVTPYETQAMHRNGDIEEL